MPIPASTCEDPAPTRSTSGAGPSVRARCTASAPTRARPRSFAPPSRPGSRPIIPSANGTGSRSPSGARRSGRCSTASVVIPGATIPDLPARGRLALQHHGGRKDGQWTGPPSLLQFKNLFIKEMAGGRHGRSGPLTTETRGMTDRFAPSTRDVRARRWIRRPKMPESRRLS